MNIDSFLGSDAAKALLKGQFANGSLAHSMLLCGEAGCGTGYFARLLAADLLATDPAAADGAARAHRVLQGTDPDCIEVEGEGVSGQITVKRVRDVRTEVQQTSLSGSRRVVIIYGAQNLNASSANSLLKIVEEPPEGLFFLITTPSAGVVLPTIRSRCAAIQLLAPGVEVCAAALACRGVAEAEADHLARVWQGRIGSAMACTIGPRRTLFAAAENLCRAIAAGDAYALMQLFAPYEKEREALQTLLSDAAQILHSGLTVPHCLPEPAVATAAIRALLDTSAHLRANGNAKLALTALSLQLGA